MPVGQPTGGIYGPRWGGQAANYSGMTPDQIRQKQQGTWAPPDPNQPWGPQNQAQHIGGGGGTQLGGGGTQAGGGMGGNRIGQGQPGQGGQYAPPQFQGAQFQDSAHPFRAQAQQQNPTQGPMGSPLRAQMPQNPMGQNPIGNGTQLGGMGGMGGGSPISQPNFGAQQYPFQAQGGGQTTPWQPQGPSPFGVQSYPFREQAPQGPTMPGGPGQYGQLVPQMMNGLF